MQLCDDDVINQALRGIRRGVVCLAERPGVVSALAVIGIFGFLWYISYYNTSDYMPRLRFIYFFFKVHTHIVLI